VPNYSGVRSAAADSQRVNPLPENLTSNNHTMKINSEGKLEIHPQDIVDNLSKEHKMEFIKHYLVSSDVIQTVLDYICDDDPDGWWTGDSDEIRAAFLKKVEDTHLAKFSQHNWKSLGEACKKITKIRSEQHLYWKLYHHPECHNMTISEWLMKNEIDGDIMEHTSKVADDEIAQIISEVKKEITGLIKSS